MRDKIGSMKTQGRRREEYCVRGLAGCAIFYGSGYFLNNLIGAVYVNKSLDTVKLSYIDFWGQRMNMECPINDIVPLSDQPIEKKLFKMTKS
ncbi:Transmembrane protein 186 [Gryllus bimaculatus]|nr:Transmembrane protein 186 [Gryllus bimaculatus]